MYDSNVRMIEYDHNKALHYKAEGLTNEQIAKLFGYSNESGFRRRYDREVRKGVNAARTHKKKKTKNTRGNPRPDKHDALEYHEGIELNDIRNIPYGKLEPTEFISDRGHLDWLRYYIGEVRYRYDLKPLNELQSMLWEGHKELGLLPRHGGKTVTYLGMTAREIAERREPHLTICSPKRPKVLFRSVSNVLLKSSQFRKDYGDIILVEEGRVQSNKTELTMQLHDEFFYPYTDPVYRSASRESDIIGNHPMHIHFEDPTQQESVAGTKKLIEWYGDVLEPMLSLEDDIKSRLTATTTRKGRKDFANYLFEDGWDEFRYAAIEIISGRLPTYQDIVWKDHTTRSGQKTRKIDHISVTGEFKLFNPNWNLQSLLEIAVRKYSSFMSQYQNTPIAVDSDFLEPLEIIEPIDRKHYENQEVMIIDPAFGKSAAASETAIIIGFAPANMEDIFITEVVIDKLPGSKLVKKIYELYDKHKIKWAKIEDDFYQMTTRQGVMNALRKLPNFGPFYNKGFGDKHARIQMLEEPLVMRQIKVFNTCRDLYKLEDQVNGYSEESDVRHGHDGVDALSSFHRIVSKVGQLWGRSWTSRR